MATPAAATPSPVTGTSTALSVLGADDGGEANLTYTWVATGTPPAPVSFSVNGTNGAKNTTATFTAAGNYSFQVTITDAGGLSTTSSVNVTVAQTLTSHHRESRHGDLVRKRDPAVHRHGLRSVRQRPGRRSRRSPGPWPAASAASMPPASIPRRAIRAPQASAPRSGAVSGTASVTVYNAAPTVATPAAATSSPVTGTSTVLERPGGR